MVILIPCVEDELELRDPGDSGWWSSRTLEILELNEANWEAHLQQRPLFLMDSAFTLDASSAVPLDRCPGFPWTRCVSGQLNLCVTLDAEVSCLTSLHSPGRVHTEGITL